MEGAEPAEEGRRRLTAACGWEGGGRTRACSSQSFISGRDEGKLQRRGRGRGAPDPPGGASSGPPDTGPTRQQFSSEGFSSIIRDAPPQRRRMDLPPIRGISDVP
ncbi:hypothetical protein OJAV_G00143420 [Oryzias javanicus]|uniref:Uncharacterized protein n=1 Tax=Oryzias javanicus TaxID=123683 RepID=A0A437CNZ0_ORYJA|nr:hypothetical protein OJAV_G00143420 [Oryzias javanicus]